MYGDTLVIYASGLGPTLNDPVPGSPAALDVLSRTLLPFQVVLKSGAEAKLVTPDFAGLAPLFIAVDHVNVRIPVDAPTGSVQLYLQSDTLGKSTPVTLTI